ncbi:NAD-dependent epimerase/dehydratase family protein [Paracoccus sp. (in: a-proteobacteria)]|uniref:NAD-dependent epimerase/dehydratase family protein n=1 Tax=Paracoccus sp. TaxID=267 RepID=UPI00321FB417
MSGGTAGRLAGRHLFVLGLGYAAQELARQAMAEGARVSGTTRDAGKADRLRAAGITILAPSDGGLPADALAGVTDLLISVPPQAAGCPALAMARTALQHADALRWIGYLSSTAVYGDCGGEWIDETRPPAPRGDDARARLLAEEEWRAAARAAGAACDVLRIAGIYGPGRDRLASLREGKARVIDKPGQVFNRIHRDDIAGAALAAMLSPAGERLTNLADGQPCSSVEMMTGLADMLGLPAPEITAHDPAASAGPMAGFFAENRRIRNDRLRALPGFALRYPDWQAGYRAIIAAEAA